MSLNLPTTPFLPGTKESIIKFSDLIEYLMETSRGDLFPWPVSDPWPMLDPEEILSDLKNQGWGADLDRLDEWQSILKREAGDRLPTVCLLRTLHPLTFILRLYCQKYESLIEDWIEWFVTEMKFSELIEFCARMSKSSFRFGQSKSPAEWAQALEYLVKYDFTGMIWCDWILTEGERSLFLEMTKGHNLQLVEQPLLKPVTRTTAVLGIKVIFLTDDHVRPDSEVAVSLRRALGGASPDWVEVNTIPDFLALPHLTGPNLILVDIKKLFAVSDSEEQSINTDMVCTLRRQCPMGWLMVLANSFEQTEENSQQLRLAGVDSVVFLPLAPRELALAVRETLSHPPLSGKVTLLGELEVGQSTRPA